MSKIHIILLAIGMWFCSTLHAEVVVVVSKDSKLSSISKKDLKRLYTGKTKKVNSIRLNPCVNKNKDTHKAFLKKYVSRTPLQFSKTWQKLVFSGKAALPKRYSDEDIVEAVADNDKLIAYIDRSLVTDKVKVLKVE